MKEQNGTDTNRTVNLSAMKRVLAVSLLVLASVMAASGQSTTDGSTPSGLSPGSPTGSYALSGFENVNLYSGGLDVHVPVYSIGGRGETGSTIAVAVTPNPWLMKGTGVGTIGGRPCYRVTGRACCRAAGSVLSSTGAAKIVTLTASFITATPEPLLPLPHPTGPNTNCAISKPGASGSTRELTKL